jgi:isoleucyl-tRNA synthetase
MTETEYKDTLNLPKTDFPMKANLTNKEPEILKNWDDINLYQKIRAKHASKELFVLADGPPYANGKLHMGHALNKILKDINIKAKTFSGLNAAFVPGWDCHGLPIELQVEKKFGKVGDKLDAKQFRAKCREYANSQIDLQRASFIRLGVLGDWFQPYKTMDYKFEADVIRTMAKVIENGHLQRGDRPVHWCVNCSSALAEAEVEYQDKVSKSIYVTFTVVEQNKIIKLFTHPIASNLGDGEISVVIWTTTPWSLPANQAVCLNENISYALVQLNNKRYVLAEDLVVSFTAILKLNPTLDKLTILATAPGRVFEHLLLNHPFYNKTVPVLLAAHVSIEAGGTGCVHTAPVHGHDDYIVCNKYAIKLMPNPVAANGCFYPEVSLVSGLHIFKADDKIIEILREQGNLLAVDKLSHSYPHCWRHKTPLIFRATPQWFMSMDKNDLRQKALEAIKKVQWIPDWGQTRITNMISDRPDWCISRQRTWGVPIALIIDKKTKDLHPDILQLMQNVATKVEQQGIDAWFDLDLNQLLGKDGEQYEKINDTLDVWLESGSVFKCVLEAHPELSFPADLFLEGSDQHRGWFHSSLLLSVAMHGVAPYKQVLTHGYTVDANGRKFSKSLGNGVAPEDIIKTLGADIIRLWVTASDYRQEVHVSKEIFSRISDAYRRIRNTARYLLSNLNDFKPSQDLVPGEKMLILDQWIVLQTKQLQVEIIELYNNYQFNQVYQKLHNFCVTELGSFYLDVIKDRQYTGKHNGIPRRSCQTAMYYIVESLVRLVAPVLSFTAEEIWQHTSWKQEESVFLSTWFTAWPKIVENPEFNNNYWREILNIRDAVNVVLEQSRKSAVLGSGLEAELTLYCNNNLYKTLYHLKDELRFVLITSQANIVETTTQPEHAVSTSISGLYIHVAISKHEKCSRCWHRRAEVNQHKQYPNICARCIENLGEIGEIRSFA